jgi:hypothetical protein
MNWRTLDLNLLIVFDAVAQERSATRAAAKGLSGINRTIDFVSMS